LHTTDGVFQHNGPFFQRHINQAPCDGPGHDWLFGLNVEVSAWCSATLEPRPVCIPGRRLLLGLAAGPAGKSPQSIVARGWLSLIPWGLFIVVARRNTWLAAGCALDKERRGRATHFRLIGRWVPTVQLGRETLALGLALGVSGRFNFIGRISMIHRRRSPCCPQFEGPELPPARGREA